jgi:hypothetical protein
MWWAPVLVVALADQSAAPQRPNFTGVWRVNFHKSRLQIEAPESTVFTIKHDEPNFVLSRTHVFGGKSDTWGIRLTTDGTEVIQSKDGRTLHCRMHWQGRILVFEVRIVGLGEEATNVVRYEMADDAGSLTGYERYRGPARSYDNTWVLERQPGKR